MDRAIIVADTSICGNCTPNGSTAAFAIALLVLSGEAAAQRASENAAASASDGFGTSIGNERVGIYTPSSVRGFSPITAGNRRIEGLYFDLGGNGLTNRLTSGSVVRVGLPALAYPFPAPSGIVDYRLRPSGDAAVLSVVAARPAYGGYLLELDAQAPLIDDRLSLAAGVSDADQRFADGRKGIARAVAVIPTLRLGDTAFTAFWSASETGGDVPPIIMTRGPSLPPVIRDNRFYGQNWTQNSQKSQTYGLLGRLALADELSLRVGAFESRSTRERSFSDLFLDVRPDGMARNVVIAEPRLPARWTSGEARLSWARDGKAFDHSLHLSLRGRDKRLELGGSSTVALGPARIGTLTPYPKPSFAFSPPTINTVQQWSVGAAYIGRWSDRLELNVSLQAANYESMISRNDRGARTKDTPLLYNATLAYAPADWLSFYGNITKGLEETSGPPSSAANRDDAIPASRTKQQDAGVRLALGPMRIVAGVFEIERPYFSTDRSNVYTALGDVRNRGAELSVVGQITDQLSVVSGLVLLDARVVGEAFELGRAGRRPVGSMKRSGRVDLDYRTTFVDGLSLTFGIQHTGPMIASTTGYTELGGEQLEIGAYTTFDIGARYRFNIGEVPMSARVLLANTFDERGYFASSSNTFGIRDTRRLSLQLSADF